MRRWTKPALIGIIGLSTVMFAFSVLLPDHVMTSKSVKVSLPVDSVIHELKDLNNWSTWNLLLQGATKVSVVDSTLNWISANGNTNSIHIDTVNEKGISTSLILHDSRPFISGFAVEKRPNEDSVQVVWYIIEELKWYPWEKFYGMIAADMKGPLMEESLIRFRSKL